MPHNKGMKLAKPETLGGCWHDSLGIIESGFAAYAQCCADQSWLDRMTWLNDMLIAFRDLIELAVLILAVCLSMWPTWRLQRNSRIGWPIRVAVGALSIVAGLGFCVLPYQPNPDLHLIGLPLPLVVFHRENGQWIDYLASPARMILVAGLNLLLVTGIVHAIAIAVFAMRRRRAH